MSDEKRQTRLLPFRLRRAGRAGAGGPEDLGADAELTALLREWEAPQQSLYARERLLADFRASARVAPLWRRALAAQVRVPLPVAACAALALLLTPLAFGARPWTKPAPAASAAAESAPAVRVVEVPVIQERVVERVVYVEKKERGARRGVSSEPGTSGSLASAEPTVLKRVEAPAQAAPQEASAAATEASGGYFTRVDMQDFQPANEVKFRRLSRGSVDEK